MTDDVKAIVVNHTFGIRFPDIEAVASLGVPVIEDCCHAPFHAIGEESNSVHSLCSFYSFNGTKYLTTGEGGAIATRDDAFSRILEERKIGVELSDFAASLGLAQLERINEFRERRTRLAARYARELHSHVDMIPEGDSVYFRYPLWIDSGASLPWGGPVAFRRGVDALVDITADTPWARAALASTLSVPIYPALTTAEQEVVIQEVRRLHVGD
jgi:perosamine synthetase